jgi:hypothetical protein
LKLPPETKFYVLGPEKDIDGYYLGEELDARLDTVRGLAGRLVAVGGAKKASRRPANISASDFEVLRARMLSNARAFVQHETSLTIECVDPACGALSPAVAVRRPSFAASSLSRGSRQRPAICGCPIPLSPICAVTS